MPRGSEPPERRTVAPPAGARSGPSGISDDALRKAFAASPGDGGERDLQAVQRALDGETSPAEMRALLDRMAEDPELAEAWRLGFRLRRELRSDETASRGRASLRRWGLATAVAAVLAVAVVWVPRAISPPAPPVVRGEDGAIESLLAAGLALPRERFDLRWRAQLEAPLYEVEVLDADLVLLHRAGGLDAPRLRVPAEALAGLEPSADVLWRVEAVAADGSRYASATFRQRLR